MLQARIFDDKWLSGICFAVLFACVAVFAYTGNYLALAAPFGFMYVLLMGINWKTAYWILLFCIPLSTQLSFNDDTLSTSLPDEPMMWLFFLLFIVMVARNPALIPQWWWRNPLVFIIALQFIWLIIPVIYSEVPFFSVKFLISKAWYLAVFFIMPLFIFQEKKDFKKAFLFTLVPLLATMLIIFYRHALIGFNFRKVEKAIHPLYYNHVDYSTVMSMFFPLLCVAYPLTKGYAKWIRVVLLLIILFFLPAIYLIYARAAYIAVVFAGVIALAIRFRLVNFIMPTIYALLAAMIIYLSTDNKYIQFRPNYEHTYMHKSFTDHMIATIKGQDMSSMERVYRWVAGARMSMDKPITGYGPHAFYYYYKPYAVTSFITYVSRNTEHSTTHNYFMYMLVEQGWPAMILYAILIYVVFAQAQKTYWRFTDRYYKYVTLGVIMMFAAGFINNFFSELLETHKVGSMFYLSIALLVILDKKSRDMAEQKEITHTSSI